MLSRLNCRSFHRRIYRNQIQPITLLKRSADQQQGTVTSFTLYQCWRANITKTGEAIQLDMDANNRTRWFIPRTELLRISIDYLSVLDRIVDARNRYWQPEAGDVIDINLFENCIFIDCQRIDPPGNIIKPIPGAGPSF